MSESHDVEELMHGDDGFSGEEDLEDDAEEELEPLDQSSPPPRDEQRATIIAFVARRQLNTIDTKPGGYAWFSA